MKKILFFAFGVWISIVSFGQGQAVKDSLQAIVGDSIGNSLQQISSSLEDATKAECIYEERLCFCYSDL